MRRVDPGAVWELIDERGRDALQRRADRADRGRRRTRRRTALERPVTVLRRPPRRRRRRCFARMAELNFRVVHVYGLTETYGPITVCAVAAGVGRRCRRRAGPPARPPGAGVPDGRPRARRRRARRRRAARRRDDGRGRHARQQRHARLLRRRRRRPAQAFRGGWFHSGDLAVWHPDGNVELRDRAKDIIISGGENISTIEVEQAVVPPPGRARVRRRRHAARALGRAAEGVRDAAATAPRRRPRS